MEEVSHYSLKRDYLTSLTNPGLKNSAGVDYSATDGRFVHLPVQAELMAEIPKELVLIIEDTDTAPDKFGNLAALVNGIRIVVEDSSNVEKADLLAGEVIKKVSDFHRLGGHMDALNESDGTTKSLRVRLPLYNNDYAVRSHYNERVAVILSDDLSALPGLYFILEYETLKNVAYSR